MQQNQNPEKLNYRYFAYIFLLIFVLIIGIEVYGYFKYSDKKINNEKLNNSVEIIQIDVLNGCGISGVGQKFTDHLRNNGFDVVASSNYKNFYVDETFIIDRIGNDNIAKELAQVLNIAPEKIVKEINPSYFVAFSVVSGKNFKNNLTKKE